MPNECCAIMRRWFAEVWNDGREATIDELLDDNASLQGLGAATETVTGIAGFKEFYKRLRGALSEIHIEIDEAVGEGEIAALRWTARARHTGDGLGIPATNRPVTFTGMSFAQARNGKAIAAWNNWDMAGLMNQIGAASNNAAEPRS
jgi:steroid delta-isomerase-like uncharacterized protein